MNAALWSTFTAPLQELRCHTVDTDALVICGGEQSALADATYSYLPARCSLMRDMTIAAKPVLGICLGARHWCNLHHRHRAGVWLVQGAADAKRSARPGTGGHGATRVSIAQRHLHPARRGRATGRVIRHRRAMLWDGTRALWDAVSFCARAGRCCRLDAALSQYLR
jgi:hypothetical protein